jgi:hypothetical protein
MKIFRPFVEKRKERKKITVPSQKVLLSLKPSKGHNFQNHSNTATKTKIIMTVFTNHTVSHKTITRKAAKSPSSRISATDSAKLVCEGLLQSSNKRRRYQRRGSKCPSMLHLNTVQVSNYLADLESRAVAEDNQLLTCLTGALNLSSCSSLLEGDALAWALNDQVTPRMLFYRNSITVLNIKYTSLPVILRRN